VSTFDRLGFIFVYTQGFPARAASTVAGFAKPQMIIEIESIVGGSRVI